MQCAILYKTHNNYKEENKENLGDASAKNYSTENSYSEENNVNSLNTSINPLIENTIIFSKEEQIIIEDANKSDDDSQ